MKTIEVKDQVRLSLAKCFELVLSGLRFRLFRAAVTVVIISLAAAFLMTMLSESLISRQVRVAVKSELAPRRQLLFWVGRISAPLNHRELTRELAGVEAAGDPWRLVEPGSDRWKEFQAFSADPAGGQAPLTDEELGQLVQVAEREVAYVDGFFGTLNEGELRELVGRDRGAAILELLRKEPERLERFKTVLPEMGLLSKLPGSVEGLGEFLTEWDRVRPWRERILAGHRRAVEAVARDKDLLQGRSATRLLSTAGADLAGRLTGYDFHMAAGEFSIVRRQAALSADAESIRELLKIQTVKTRLASRRNVAKVGDVSEEMLFKEISSAGGATWLLAVLQDLHDRADEVVKQLPALRKDVADLKAEIQRREAAVKEIEGNIPSLEAEEKAAAALKSAREALKKVESENQGLVPARKTIEAFTLDAERVERVAEERLDQSGLADVEATLAQSEGGAGGFLGFGVRTQWLILVSFMVCAVGIANAMLMSVTERFQEIATMKCLGATDGFIMTNFVLESIMQGVAGGVAGTLLGLLLGMLRGSVSYGLSLALTNLPGWGLLASAGVSMVVGVVVSALAAVYPAWVAARLAPMEAMRIE